MFRQYHEAEEGSLTLKKLKIVAETADGPEKYASFMLARIAMENILAYDLLMRRFFLLEFDWNLPFLDDKWSKRCWTCGKTEPAKLKTCTVCKWAKYCGRACQAQGRKFDKMLDERVAF